ncbi:hypothetical protein Dsin_027227 [Dipteronia sinensis]|uniref:Uncharacterized protein n=1 Tax=Dipteronia sinensis TaxID=43782 RepID=A0AAD9ZPU4_9ROSI|nr:hypothetical protein Dsin_027227 [Dipteronia sinensis]
MSVKGINNYIVLITLHIIEVRLSSSLLSTSIPGVRSMQFAAACKKLSESCFNLHIHESQQDVAKHERLSFLSSGPLVHQQRVGKWVNLQPNQVLKKKTPLNYPTKIS